MKKGINKKALILPLFILTVLAVNLVMISAADGFWGGASDWLESTILPEGIEQGGGSILVAIIGLILIFVIIGDLLSLISPLSDWVNWVIGAGVTIILVTMGTARILIGLGMTLVTTIFGIAGMGALIGTAVLFLLLVVFIFFGGIKLQKILTQAKGRSSIMRAQKKAYDQAAKMKAGETKLRAIGSS